MIDVEEVKIYKFKIGDFVQLRDNVKELIEKGAIRDSYGYVRAMDKLVGKRLTINHLVNGGRGARLRECPDNYGYDTDWFVPYNDEIGKLKEESERL